MNPCSTNIDIISIASQLCSDLVMYLRKHTLTVDTLNRISTTEKTRWLPGSQLHCLFDHNQTNGNRLRSLAAILNEESFLSRQLCTHFCLFLHANPNRYPHLKLILHCLFKLSPHHDVSNHLLEKMTRGFPSLPERHNLENQDLIDQYTFYLVLSQCVSKDSHRDSAYLASLAVNDHNTLIAILLTPQKNASRNRSYIEKHAIDATTQKYQEYTTYTGRIDAFDEGRLLDDCSLYSIYHWLKDEKSDQITQMWQYLNQECGQSHCTPAQKKIKLMATNHFIRFCLFITPKIIEKMRHDMGRLDNFYWGIYHDTKQVLLQEPHHPVPAITEREATDHTALIESLHHIYFPNCPPIMLRKQFNLTSMNAEFVATYYQLLQHEISYYLKSEFIKSVMQAFVQGYSLVTTEQCKLIYNIIAAFYRINNETDLSTLPTYLNASCLIFSNDENEDLKELILELLKQKCGVFALPLKTNPLDTRTTGSRFSHWTVFFVSFQPHHTHALKHLHQDITKNDKRLIRARAVNASIKHDNLSGLNYKGSYYPKKIHLI